MSDKLKHEFETETAQGISYNEGVVDADENGTYNDEYVHWLERKMEAIQTKQLLPKHLSNIAYTVAKGNSYDGFVNWWNEQKVGNEDTLAFEEAVKPISFHDLPVETKDYIRDDNAIYWKNK
jgi:hypothetical protein